MVDKKNLAVIYPGKFTLFVWLYDAVRNDTAVFIRLYDAVRGVVSVVSVVFCHQYAGDCQVDSLYIEGSK